MIRYDDHFYDECPISAVKSKIMIGKLSHPLAPFSSIKLIESFRSEEISQLAATSLNSISTRKSQLTYNRATLRASYIKVTKTHRRLHNVIDKRQPAHDFSIFSLTYFCIERNMRREEENWFTCWSHFHRKKFLHIGWLNVCRASRCDYDARCCFGRSEFNERWQKAKVNGAEALCNAPII